MNQFSLASIATRGEYIIATTMDHKVQYDIEGRVLPARQGCPSLRVGVVWLVLVAALLGGFAGAFIYHRLAGNFVPTEVDNVESLNPRWTETKLAFAKADAEYLVVVKRDGLVSKPEMQNLTEFGSCIPAEEKEMLQTVAPGTVFIMRLYYDGEEQCIFDFLHEVEVFNGRNSEDDEELLEALLSG